MLTENVLDLIGNTPLLRLRGERVYAKAEFLNPGGSIKDRVAVAMIEGGERDGRLQPDSERMGGASTGEEDAGKHRHRAARSGGVLLQHCAAVRRATASEGTAYAQSQSTITSARSEISG